MKILLIQPPLKLFRFEIPSVVPPLGLAYIAAVLEQEHDVAILDAVVEGRQHSCGDMVHLGLTFDEIYREIKKQSPDIVGIGCLFSSQYEAAMRIAEIAKKHNTKVIIGGSHPSSQPEETMQDKNIDFIVLGEGEETSKQLINAIKNGKSLEKIDGIAYRKHGKIKVNPRKTWIKNLDSLPLPARHLLNMKKYFASKTSHGPELMRTPYTSMITSRGCPFSCIFCDHPFGKTVRMHSPEYSVKEIEILVNKYGAREIQFHDENLMYDKERLRKICDKIIEKKIDITWSCYARADRADYELFKKMNEAGCWMVSFGIESGNQEVLNFIKKGTTLEIVRKAVAAARKAGLQVRGSYMVGHPIDTKETIKETIKFVKSLKLDHASCAITVPYPGSELYEIADKYGAFRKKEFSKYKRQDDNDLSFIPHGFTEKELIGIQKNARIEFYFKSTYPFRALKGIKSFAQLKRYLWGAWSILVGDFFKIKKNKTKDK